MMISQRYALLLILFDDMFMLLLFVICDDLAYIINANSAGEMIMDINNLSSDASILSEIGHRLARIRIQHNLTQAYLARQAGVSKPTVERVEAGRDTRFSSLIRMLRALDLLSALDKLLPVPHPGPMERLKTRGAERKRASSRQKTAGGPSTWSWKDEA